LFVWLALLVAAAKKHSEKQMLVSGTKQQAGANVKTFMSVTLAYYKNL
jgi:hypothetical protein